MKKVIGFVIAMVTAYFGGDAIGFMRGTALYDEPVQQDTTKTHYLPTDSIEHDSAPTTVPM